MRKNMKKSAALLLAAMMTVSVTACGGGKTPDAPSDADLKKDVQEYITEVVDESAKISNFRVEDSGEGKNDTYEANCIVTYANDTMQYVDEFDLSYEVKDNAWNLEKCKVNSDYAEKSSQAVGADTSKAQTDSSEAAEATTEAAAATATQLSDKLEDYTFMLEGDVYQLPFAYSVLADKGWRIYNSEYYDDTKINGNSYGDITLQKDKKTIDVSIINASGNAKELKDCNVGGISVYGSNKNAPEFSIAKGIKVGDKEDKVREAFGSPTDTSKYDEYNYLRYGEDDSITTIVCDNGTDEYNDAQIEIKNFVATEDDKKTETSDEVPEYLSTYVAPTELGTDPLSYNIEIENQVYTLPAPVSVFTDNGWKIASQEDSVPSGRSLSSAIKLQKDGKEIEASVTNFADYQTKPENCAISYLYFYADESKNPEVKLPGGITIKSTSEDVKKWAGDKFDYSKSGDSEYYNYYDDDNEGYIAINCKKTVSSMSVRKETWPSK